MKMMRLNLLWFFVVLFVANVCAQSERSMIRDGNRAYKDNKFTDAEVDYRKALEKNKDLHEGTFNLGDALYKQDRFDEAAEQYRAAAEKNLDNVSKAKTLYNFGNALLKGKKLPESIGAYEQSLKLSPNDEDTKYNLEYAKALLKQQQQQQNQKQKQKQDKDQQKNKQQQNQQQEQNKQDQQKQKQQEQQKQAQQKKQQISKQDAERILEALKNDEKNVEKKLQKKVPARVRIEKDW